MAEPTPERRRELLRELTRVAVEAGTYGEPAPEMRPAPERTPQDDTTERGPTMTATIPQQLEEANWKHTYDGIPIWELGEDGDLLITVGHVDPMAFAKACDAYAREIWDYSLAGAVDEGLGQIAGDTTHETARIVDPSDFPYFDFEIKFGEGDLPMTVWRAN